MKELKGMYALKINMSVESIFGVSTQRGKGFSLTMQQGIINEEEAHQIVKDFFKAFEAAAE